MLSQEDKTALTEIISHQPNKRAACIDALNWEQQQRGWVSDEHLAEIACLLDMTASELDSVATFYSLIFRRRVGKHVILICDSISCWIMGGVNVQEHLSKRLGIVPGQTTADGQFTLLPVPCLGACHRAPTMMVDEDLHVNLTAQKIDSILKRYGEQQPAAE